MSSDHKSQVGGFSPLRSFFWPLHSFELPKFFPTAMMMICVLFIYTIARNIKDATVINGPASGAEVLTFLKFYGTLPTAVLFLILFTKLSNIFSKEKIFYVITIPFLIFFLFFAWVLYPNASALHLSEETMKNFQNQFPNLQWFVPMIGNWSFSLFYILAEMWGTVVLSLLFWSFANEVTSVNEAKRFYFMFGLFGQLALIVISPAFSFAKFLASVNGSVDFGRILKIISLFQLLAGVVLLFCYWLLRNRILTNPRFHSQEDSAPKKTKKKKPKLGIKESFKYIFSSKYIGFIAVLVCSYGICINFVEVMWKAMVKLTYPDPLSYAEFMGKFTTVTGLATMSMTFIGSFILRKTNWKVAAAITPIVIAITGGLFFIFVLSKEALEPVIMGVLGVSPVYFAVILGALQNIFSKSAKYTLFDGTKEMTYIPLDEELKLKGKAAVDVVGGRLGKSGGALFQNLLLMITGGTQQTIAPVIAGVFGIFVSAWVWAVFSLAKLFQEKMNEQKQKSESQGKS